MRNRLWFSLLGSALALAASSLLAQVQGYVATEKELALGKQLAGEIEKRYRPLADSELTDRVRALAGRLARLSGMSYPVTVKFVESDSPIATPLPGGFLVLSSGLIRSLDMESELAGILAHGIAHIAERHGLAERQGYVQSAGPLIFIGPICTSLSERSGILPLRRQKIALEQEEQADELAANWLRAAGFDPAGLASGFKKLTADR